MVVHSRARGGLVQVLALLAGDRKSTRLNSSHSQISYAVFCLKKKTQDLYHLGLLADQIGRLITFATPSFIAGDPFTSDSVCGHLLSSLRRVLALSSNASMYSL